MLHHANMLSSASFDVENSENQLLFVPFSQTVWICGLKRYTIYVGCKSGNLSSNPIKDTSNTDVKTADADLTYDPADTLGGWYFVRCCPV